MQNLTEMIIFYAFLFTYYNYFKTINEGIIFQIEIEAIFQLNPDLGPSAAPSGRENKSSKVSKSTLHYKICSCPNKI